VREVAVEPDGDDPSGQAGADLEYLPGDLDEPVTAD